MKKLRISVLIWGLILLTSCASTTIIQSDPSEAKVYLNGEVVGYTPYTHSDKKIVGTKTYLKLEKEGYEPFNSSFSRSEKVDIGAIVGGLIATFPFLWTMKYNPTHRYELTPTSSTQNPTIEVQQPQNNRNTQTKADQLRELKALLDDKVITEPEFEIEKKKILNDDKK